MYCICLLCICAYISIDYVPEVELLDHRLCLFSTLVEDAKVLSNIILPLYSHQP